jgi:hypothetical protein
MCYIFLYDLLYYSLSLVCDSNWKKNLEEFFWKELKTDSNKFCLLILLFFWQP